MSTLVTGGSGFLGCHVVRRLIARGERPRVLVRPGDPASALSGLAVETIEGDLLDRKALRRALGGCRRIFHVAGRLSTHAAETETMWRVNAEGARLVFDEALRAGCERIVYTSTVGAIACARGGAPVSEADPFRAPPGIPYIDSKRRGYEHALSLRDRGLPVVIVAPGYMLGPGDHYLSSAAIVLDMAAGRIPGYIDGGYAITDAEDCAEAHLRAMERGTIGDTYIVGGENLSIREMMTLIATELGVATPRYRLPTAVALIFARASEFIERLGGPRAALDVAAVRMTALDWRCDSTKARSAFDLDMRSARETIARTVEWLRESGHLPNPPEATR